MNLNRFDKPDTLHTCCQRKCLGFILTNKFALSSVLTPSSNQKATQSNYETDQT